MRSFNLKKGLDLRLAGEPDAARRSVVSPSTVALVPDDFPGFIPRAAVKEGDVVVAGSPLFTHKMCQAMAMTSPVSGRVESVVRGERRKLLRVVVKPDTADIKSRRFDVAKAATADGLRELLLESGLWLMMRQRPYDIVPEADSVPRDIFVTGFDSAPLAPDLAAGMEKAAAELSRAVKALKMLTPGLVYIGVRPGSAIPVPAEAEKVEFTGPHPAGNAGVQIAAIAPVNKGETVWTLDIVTLRRIGSLLMTGEMDYRTTVAITGSEIALPGYVDTIIGADMASLLKGRLTEDASTHHLRVISGNVLTGVKTSADGWLEYPYRQVTVIPEGDDVDEFMGWASNSLDKMSESRSFLSHLLPGRRFRPDARLNGGRRAMIMSGEYEKMLPMDILPEYLIKAIQARDIDRMEALGIYEVAPEDFALCEYIDPSKLELQKTVREGLDYLRKELN